MIDEIRGSILGILERGYGVARLADVLGIGNDMLQRIRDNDLSGMTYAQLYALRENLRTFIAQTGGYVQSGEGTETV